MTIRDIAEEIKRSVSMNEVAQHYGFTPNRGGFISCPFHSDKTPSLKIYIEPGRGWNCFGCGKGGSAIDFVMALFGLEFMGAIRKINDDFRLLLPLDRKQTLKEKLESEKRHREIEAERKKAEAEKQAYNDLYHRLWDEYARLDNQRMEHAPQSPDEDIHPLYVEAVKNISNIEYQIDVLL